MPSRTKTALLVVGAFGGVLAIWLLVGFLPSRNLVPGFDFSAADELDLTRPAQFGDSFGWINSLFTALAFAGVLITLLLQRSELQLQREEMRLTREELQTTREEHARTAEAQERSASRLFLAAYMNALESLRQFSQWRMTADPARTQSAYYPVVEGLVVQARVSQTLQVLVRDLEPEIRQIHSAISKVTEVGSNVWCLEQFLNVYLEIRELIGTHRRRSEDVRAFAEAANIAQVQFDRLTSLQSQCGSGRSAIITPVVANAPKSERGLQILPADGDEARYVRKKYFSDLETMNNDLLSAIMTMCLE